MIAGAGLVFMMISTKFDPKRRRISGVITGGHKANPLAQGK